MRAVLTGATGDLGRRVATMLADDGVEVVGTLGGVADIEALTISGAGSASPNGDRADVVVDVGTSDHDRRAEQGESATEFAAATLLTADRTRARHVVFVSSAMVYGASPNNPLPLTEEAVLRPDVDFVYARQLASAEESVEQWRRAGAGRSTCVLRPAVTLAAGTRSRLANALVAGFGRRFGELDPPSQFLHTDDLARAVVLAVRSCLDGVYNVAPDGWIPGERVRALSGERPHVPLPDRLSDVIGRIRWQFQRGPIPPGLQPYTQESWVVSNGRLRAAGWTPTVTNEQAYVEATEDRWWTMVSPQRRQELALGAGAVAVLAVLGIGVAVLRRWLRRRRQ